MDVHNVALQADREYISKGMTRIGVSTKISLLSTTGYKQAGLKGAAVKGRGQGTKWSSRVYNTAPRVTTDTTGPLPR